MHMQFDSFSEFLAMGGYGFYVWLSIGVCLLCMVLLVIASKIEKRRLLKIIRKESARKERMRKARQAKRTTAG
ncbi:heme exporter protein CcmD [Salinimonas sp. HHU 13199]|uniref:Heme exporter protein D n=2 Tax=Salinimonas profundi TaxID=2729140 RepID=A0ABR8LGQ3_9ALTE|nr:heme exporter protein CcmD [Salinimonas profundi]